MTFRELIEDNIKYPKKYRSLETGMVVSFDGLTSGTVISLGKAKGFKVGKRYQEFFPHTGTNTTRWEEIK